MTSRDGIYLRELPAWAADIFPHMEMRGPDDVTVADVAQRYPLSLRAVRSQLQARVRAGELLELWVYDPDHSRKKIKVYRPALAQGPASQPAQADKRDRVPKTVRKGKGRR
jgi:hypothetical protein